MTSQTLKVGVPALLLCGLSACVHAHRPPVISYDDALAKAPPAQLTAEPVKASVVVAVPVPLPLPGQMKRLAAAQPIREAADPAARVSVANAVARVQPSRDSYVNAIQVYPYSAGALFQVYAAPARVTDITLQEGEKLVGPGPVAAGDTVRWLIGDTESGTGATRRVHIMLKPTRPDLSTNMVIQTDRRTYHLELRATPATYMASVSWHYPEDEFAALRARAAETQASVPAATGIDLDQLRFRYSITGDAVPWRPLRAFDDGRQVIIEFPVGIGQGEIPPLFVVAPDGKSAELVNYRVRGSRMIVDRLFAAAELRLGGKHQQRVRITRTDGDPR